MKWLATTEVDRVLGFLCKCIKIKPAVGMKRLENVYGLALNLTRKIRPNCRR